MPDKSEYVSEIIDNLRRVFQAVHGHSKHAERETGLTGPQLSAIKVMADSGPLRVSDLASRLCLHPATAVGIIDRLEAKGLASRSRSQVDRRVVQVGLTEQARRIVAEAPEVARGLLVSGLDGLPPAQLKKISHCLEQLVGILGGRDFRPGLNVSPASSRSKDEMKKQKNDEIEMLL